MTKILKDALVAIEDRQANYGSPDKNFQDISNLWNAYLKGTGKLDKEHGISPSDVAVMMVLLKTARLMATPEHRDSWVDIAGYAECGAAVS